MTKSSATQFQSTDQSKDFLLITLYDKIAELRLQGTWEVIEFNPLGIGCPFSDKPTCAQMSQPQLQPLSSGAWTSRWFFLAMSVSCSYLCLLGLLRSRERLPLRMPSLNCKMWPDYISTPVSLYPKKHLVPVSVHVSLCVGIKGVIGSLQAESAVECLKGLHRGRPSHYYNQENRKPELSPFSVLTVSNLKYL
jgi:hypothetical protein